MGRDARRGKRQGPDMAVRQRQPGSGAVGAGFVPRPRPGPRGAARAGVIVLLPTAAAGSIGGLADFDKLGRLLAQRTGCVVLLVDYRARAPSTRFPTAVDGRVGGVALGRRAPRGNSPGAGKARSQRRR